VALPPANTRQGRQYTIKKTDASAATVHVESTGDQIERGVVDLKTPLESVPVVGDGTQ
jgi:hypothetical protein